MKPISPTRLPYWLQAPHTRYLKDVIVRYVRPHFISYLHSPRTFCALTPSRPCPYRGLAAISVGRLTIAVVVNRAIFRRFYPPCPRSILVTESQIFYYLRTVSGLTQIRASRCLRSAGSGACTPFAVPRLPSARKIYRRVGGRHCLLWLDQRQTVAPSISRTFYTYSHTRPFLPFFFFSFLTTHI